MNGFGGGLVVFLVLMGITQAMILVPYWQKLEEESEPEEQVLALEDQSLLGPIRKMEVEFPDSYFDSFYKTLRGMRHLMRIAPYKNRG